MKRQILLGSFLGIFLSTVQAISAPVMDCEPDTEGIMKAYTGLTEDQDFETNLRCLLKIHETSTGITKYLAADALRPLMGGKALAGRKLNAKTQAVVEKFKKSAMNSPDLIHQSLLTEYTKGTWGFYDLFCKGPNPENCTTFLPDEKQVLKESELIGSSSMILLRTAFLHLKGKDQQFVENRLRKLYVTVPQREPLKRKVIEQIYQELFGIKLPLGSLS